MAKTENLLREIEQLERQIEAFRDYLREAELYPEQVDAWSRLRRTIALFLLRREVSRQIYQLQLRLNAARNCYRFAEKREGTRKLVGTRV